MLLITWPIVPAIQGRKTLNHTFHAGGFYWIAELTAAGIDIIKKVHFSRRHKDTAMPADDPGSQGGSRTGCANDEYGGACQTVIGWQLSYLSENKVEWHDEKRQCISCTSLHPAAGAKRLIILAGFDPIKNRKL